MIGFFVDDDVEENEDANTMHVEKKKQKMRKRMKMPMMLQVHFLVCVFTVFFLTSDDLLGFFLHLHGFLWFM